MPADLSAGVTSLFANVWNQYLTGPELMLPASFDLGAVFFFGLTGVLAAIRRGYDWVGVFVLALVTGLGGALIRDGIFIQGGPPALAMDGRYVTTVVIATFVGMALGAFVERFPQVIAYLDAVGLGAYAVVGVQKALAAGLSQPAAVMVGVINAAGGGLLRDIIVREEPLLLKPGQFYALAALFGCLVFIALKAFTDWPVPQAALVAAGATILMRVLSIRFNWRTTPVRPWFSRRAGRGPADPP